CALPIFYTRNGVPINEDVSWDYADRFSVQVGNEANQHYLKQGYETVKAHFDRERRFYAALGFDGGIWFGNGQADEETAYHVQARGLSAIAGPKSLNATNITGYWPKKLTNYLSRSEEHTSELQSRENLVCRLLLEKK